MQLEKKGVLRECQVELLGTSCDSIERAEDRELFKELCQEIGEPVIPSIITYSVEEAIDAAKKSATPLYCVPHSHWAAQAAVLQTTKPNWLKSWKTL